MSVAIGSGSTTNREGWWVALGILAIVLYANGAFGMPSKLKPSVVRQPKTPVVQQACRVTREQVPTCVVLGTFPNNPAWGRIRGGSR